jgi:hypothetical protein
MGKSHPDSGPMYMQAMLQAQALASQQQQQAVENKRADEQFAWSKQAYEDAKAQAAPINEQALKNMQQQYGIAEQAQKRYTDTFIPLEDKYIASAQGWDTPEAETQAAGAAEANVAQQLQEGRERRFTSAYKHTVSTPARPDTLTLKSVHARLALLPRQERATKRSISARWRACSCFKMLRAWVEIYSPLRFRATLDRTPRARG